MLELKNVRKIYKTKAGDVAALDGVSLIFPENGMVFITGKSGSGKTTMLNVIGGLDGIDDGEIEIYGKKFSKFSRGEYDSYRNTLIGFVFQEYNLLPDYTIEKNVGIANELQGQKSDGEAVKDILASVDINSYEGRNPSQLSGGQKQRVAIARALIKNPKIIMADEPTGALDSTTGIQVIEELKRLSKEKLVIVISHDLELANKYADRIIRLVDGKVVEDVTIKELNMEKDVFVTENDVTVKYGSDLKGDEAKELLTAVKEGKKIRYTKDSKIKAKEPTDESKIEKSGEEIKLIKSKMKFRSAAMLGAKALKTKPLRLILTIILSVFAFAVFGVFDTIASYDRARAISDLLQGGKFENLMVRAENISENGTSYKMNMSEDYISQLNAETGYNFRPVYNVKDFVSSSYATVKSTNAYYICNTSNSYLPSEMKGRGYYYDQIEGVIEFKNSEIDGFYDIPSYGYTCIAGRYPKLSGTDGSSIGYTEVAISKYMAETMMHYLKDDFTFFGKRIELLSDLLDCKFKPAKADMDRETPPFIIKGIYDCGEIPARYDFLKTAEVKDSNDPNNAEIVELNSFLRSGPQKLLFLAEGEIEYSIERYGKPVAYFDEPTKYYIDDNSSGYVNAMDAMLFSSDTVSAKNVIMFDTLTNLEAGQAESYTLKDNEVLIRAVDLDLLFEEEVALKNHDEYGHAATEFEKQLESVLYESDGNVQFIMMCLANMFNLSNGQLVEGAYPSIDPSRFENDPYSRDLTFYREVLATKTTYAHKLKVVGVYFDVQEIQTGSQYGPLVMNKNTLQKIGIDTNQGYYPMATSLVNTDKAACDSFANLLTNSDGISIHWYANSTISNVAKNEQWVAQFTELFLYASLVLAFFSMIMLFNYISASIVSKRQSIGILRALGSNSGDVFKMFITESVIIALISGVLAVATSWIACIVVNTYLIEVMKFVVNFVLFGIRQVFVILGISLLTAVISSLVPIIKIAREKPVDLIRRP